MHYARPEPGPERSNFIVRLTNLTGAALSLALLAGVGVWGTKMVMRDVSGVPVVRATEGPMREAPADPGGDAAANQGLAVNAVAAEGTAAAPADRLVLAPPPLELSLEDVAPLTQAVEAAGRAACRVDGACAAGRTGRGAECLDARACRSDRGGGCANGPAGRRGDGGGRG
jgi:hypothetical protein